MKGKIIRLRADRGFGFVSPEGATGHEDEHFLHARNVLSGIEFADLQVGDVIEFDSQNSPKGLVAVNAQLSN